MLTEGDVSLTGVRVTAVPRLRLTEAPAPAGSRQVAARIAVAHWRLGLMVADMLAAIASVLLAVVGRFGVSEPLGPTAPYVGLIIASPLVWLALLSLTGTYSERRIGSGASEFGRVAQAGLWLLAAIVGVSYVSHSELSREVTAVTVTAATALTVGVHLLGRVLLLRRLRVGGALHRVIVVGTASEATSLVDHITRLPHSGLRVAGLCLAEQEPGPDGERHLGSSVEDIIRVARDAGADTVAIAGSAILSGSELRRLSWDLEGTGIRLLVAPGVTELAGPRLVVHPLGGLPLLVVKEALFNGPTWALKAAVDRVVSALLCVLLLPLFAAITLAIRLDSPGPILFRQRRVGLHGQEFTVLKFRTMRDGADGEREDLAALNDHDGILFKIFDDPRITRVGRLLRRCSLDELPQLWNVLTGSMSLVGPRPPLRSEVERYPADLRRRRLLVKPGMTGLWQVSGRSDLPWAETVRLDLQYVESWSVLLDVLVLWKTLRVVVTGRGAY
ncbi:MAG TPA: sugar transferase [Candidatus Binatia bacterium]|nr:sugar transferase [Candidatus Binatia bacterium]